MTTMVKIPIPKTVWRDTWSYVRQPLGDLLWKTGVLGVALLVTLTIASAGPGFLVGALLVVGITTVTSDKFDQIISDIWHRNFVDW